MGLRADLERRVVGMQHTPLYHHILTGTVFFGHGLGGLYHNGIVPCLDYAVAYHHILTGIRIYAVIIGASHIVENPYSPYHYPAAAGHMQGPQC